MKIFNKKQPSLIFFSIFFTIFIYLVYNICSGNRGIISMKNLKNLIERNEKILNELQKEEGKIKKKILLLRGKNIDKDLLDERARIVLNFADENDLIIDFDSINLK